jgi:DegV family protein with EDD domain
MRKIKFITDTACDIPDEQLLKYDIDMRYIPITIDGAGYHERKDFSVHQFYELLKDTKEIPKTSAIMAPEYLECYKKAREDGYSDVIVVTINAGGSAIFAQATLAKKMFFEECPQAVGKINIHIVDSGTYSMAYGLPVLEAARMASEGAPVEDILKYLTGWFSSVEIYLGVYSLEYAKKSGRIGAAAAFVGDVLGLRPVIAMIGGGTQTIDKVRGDKAIVPRLVQAYRDNCKAYDPEPMVVCGTEPEYAKELCEALEKEACKPVKLYNVGAAITVNSGPRMVAVIARGKPR